MTLQENIAKYAGIVHRQSAKELKDNPKFMKACRENGEFKQWVLDRKPTMATVKVSKIKFRRPDDVIVPVDHKEPTIEPEPVEKISKTSQIMKDLKDYKKKQGFI
jgi:hypothetical protein